jgi:hypothetical protein
MNFGQLKQNAIARGPVFPETVKIIAIFPKDLADHLWDCSEEFPPDVCVKLQIPENTSFAKAVRFLSSGSKPMKKVSISIPQDLWEQAKIVAWSRHQTFSALLSDALGDLFETAGQEPFDLYDHAKGGRN